MNSVKRMRTLNSSDSDSGDDILPECDLFEMKLEKFREIKKKESWKKDILKYNEEKESQICDKKNKLEKTSADQEVIDVENAHYVPLNIESKPQKSKSIVPTTKLSKSAKKRLEQFRRHMQRTKKEIDAEHEVIKRLDFNENPDDCEILEVNPIVKESQKENDIKLLIHYDKDIVRFSMKKTEEFSIIYSQMATYCNAKISEVMLCYEDKNILLEDTPEKLKLSLINDIDCILYNPKTVESHGSSNLNHFNIKIQSDLNNKKTLMQVHKMEPMKEIMKKYAEMCNISIENLIFEFDGQRITGTETPEELDMEDDVCIDAKIIDL